MPKKEEKLEKKSPEVEEVTEAAEAIEAVVIPEIPLEVDTAVAEETPEDASTEDVITEAASEEVDDAIEPEITEEPTISVEPEFSSSETGTDKTVTVQQVKFASFEDLNKTQGETNKNLEILMDIKLQLTVELGRTELPIKKVLELTRGSIIELEKVAGEPVELYANGKLVAHGEVVVIEDNFGLRITSITEPEDRLKGI